MTKADIEMKFQEPLVSRKLRYKLQLRLLWKQSKVLLLMEKMYI